MGWLNKDRLLVFCSRVSDYKELHVGNRYCGISKAHQERYTGSIGAFDCLTFWEEGQILSATTSDDVAWTAQRLLNQGHPTEFSQSPTLDQPLSFRCFPQVPAIVLRRAVVSRMNQNLFVCHA